MSFNINNAANYIAVNSKELALKSVTQAKTAKILIDAESVQFDVKGSAKILQAGGTSVFQDGKACGRTGLSTINLADKTITVAYISDKLDYCPADLIDITHKVFLKPGADKEQDIDAALANKISEIRSSLIAENIESLLWRGDTSLTSDNVLKWYNGILAQVSEDSYINIYHDSGETNLIKKLQQSFLKMPDAISSQSDFVIFVSPKIYNAYKIAVDDKNYFNEKGEEILRGTNARIISVPGLSHATKQEVVMTRLKNLRLGFDGSDESEKVTLRYSVETEKWYSDYFFSNGICVIYPEEVGYADYSGPEPTTTTTTTTTGA